MYEKYTFIYWSILAMLENLFILFSHVKELMCWILALDLQQEAAIYVSNFDL